MTTPTPVDQPPRSRAALAVLALWVVAVVVVTVQGVVHARGNFLIFRGAFDALVHARNIYAPAAPGLDLFKYSPSFALLFAPFAVGPVAVGWFLWTAVNAALLYLALGRLLDGRDATFARAFVFLEMLGSLQNGQSNALVAALVILAFTELSRGRQAASAASVVLGTCIKIFPAAAGSALLFHPRKARYVLLCVAGGAIMLLAPLLVTSPAVLLQQYAWWHAVESKDALDRMYSVMQQVHLWLGVDWPNWPQQLAGVVLLLLPVALRRSRLGERAFQQLFLASLLMFCVLFNHQSESPTFVIAVCGVALWFLATPRSAATWALLAFVFVGTTLVKSDVMPRAWQRAFFDPTYFKTVPVLVTWVVTQVQLWRAPSAHAEVHELDVAAREPGT